MRCEVCGAEFRPSGHGRPQKYCSESCRNKAKYRRRRNRAGDAADKPGMGEVPAAKGLDRREFERMMDDGVEDAIRLVRDRMKAALEDTGTPANALPAIGRQYIELCERLQNMDDGGGLFDQADPTEVNEDAGASIV